MPIYEYKCQKCGYSFEQLQRVTDEPPCVCPECKSKSLVKLVSNTSFQLKGSGWYVTDFKNKKAEEEKGNIETKPTQKDDKPKEKLKDNKKAKETESK